MSEKIRVLVIEPGKNQEEREIDNTLEALQEIVGGHIECVTMATDLVVICNEEGRLMDLPFNCEICNVLFVGTILMAGVKRDEFADLPASLDDMKRMFPGLWMEENEQHDRVQSEEAEGNHQIPRRQMENSTMDH